jgi:hypothetical protein
MIKPNLEIGMAATCPFREMAINLQSFGSGNQ